LNRLRFLVRAYCRIAKNSNCEYPPELHDSREDPMTDQTALPEQFQSELDHASVRGARNLTKR
jgi:hypothetical protein